MTVINRFNCPHCLWGEVTVNKVDEYREETEDGKVRYCMRAVYKSSCNCVIKGEVYEKSKSQETPKIVRFTLSRQGGDPEESLEEI